MMDTYQQEIEIIQSILKENPKGMTVTDISRKIKINRNSVAKYLDIMRISGLVDMITFGPAKVYFPTRRVPINDMLNYTSDYILIFDSNMKITMINDSFLNFLDLNRKNIIGETIEDIIIDIFKEGSEILIGIKEALNGKRFKQEFNFKRNKEIYFFIVKLIPTTFEDGRLGATLILRNNTHRKIAENFLKESEQNFKRLIDKMK